MSTKKENSTSKADQMHQNIAEALGWSNFRMVCGMLCGDQPKDCWWFHRTICVGGYIHTLVPSYSHEYDSIMNAIKKLIIGKSTIIQHQSNEALFCDQVAKACEHFQVPSWHFYPETWCEILLRTIGKYPFKHSY